MQLEQDGPVLQIYFEDCFCSVLVDNSTFASQPLEPNSDEPDAVFCRVWKFREHLGYSSAQGCSAGVRPIEIV